MRIDTGGRGCRLCPRACGARRDLGERGFCGADSTVRVGRAAPHLWEEPCICAEGGSGAVFFSGCPLGCVYCQNRTIAGGESGIAVSVEDLAETYLALAAKGVCNINLVTAGHYAPWVAESLRVAKKKGLALPVIFNSGGYESVATLKLLDGLIDIYLPDFKYTFSSLSKRYSHAEDYPEIAKRSIAEMVRQVGETVWDGVLLRRGVLVRILLLPGALIDAKATLRYLFSLYGNRIAYSLMRQYTPPRGMEREYPEIARRVTDAEYFSFVEYARELGVEQGFTQEADSASESFIPAFDGFGVCRASGT